MKILNTSYEDETVEIEAEAGEYTLTFGVQLVENRHRSELGCLLSVYENGLEIELNDKQEELFDLGEIIEQAEDYGASVFASTYEEKPIRFHCAINCWTVIMRIDKSNGSVQLIIEDVGNIGGYNMRYEETGKTFDTEEAALEYADTFRTDDYQDCSGLYAFMQAISNKGA